MPVLFEMCFCSSAADESQAVQKSPPGARGGSRSPRQQSPTAVEPHKSVQRASEGDLDAILKQMALADSGAFVEVIRNPEKAPARPKNDAMNPERIVLRVVDEEPLEHASGSHAAEAVPRSPARPTSPPSPSQSTQTQLELSSGAEGRPTTPQMSAQHSNGLHGAAPPSASSMNSLTPGGGGIIMTTFRIDELGEALGPEAGHTHNMHVRELPTPTSTGLRPMYATASAILTGAVPSMPYAPRHGGPGMQGWGQGSPMHAMLNNPSAILTGASPSMSAASSNGHQHQNNVSALLTGQQPTMHALVRPPIQSESTFQHVQQQQEQQQSAHLTLRDMPTAPMSHATPSPRTSSHTASAMTADPRTPGSVTSSNHIGRMPQQQLEAAFRKQMQAPSTNTPAARDVLMPHGTSAAPQVVNTHNPYGFVSNPYALMSPKYRDTGAALSHVGPSGRMSGAGSGMRTVGAGGAGGMRNAVSMMVPGRAGGGSSRTSTRPGAGPGTLGRAHGRTATSSRMALSGLNHSMASSMSSMTSMTSLQDRKTADFRPRWR